jgi:hypothetical protein
VCDFLLFEPIKMELRSKHFLKDKVKKGTVQTFLKAWDKNDSPMHIHKLVDRWTKCIMKEGDNVEKWYELFLFYGLE